MRTLQLLAALCVAACGAPSPTPPEVDPNTDTTRGMGDAGHLTPTDAPEQCAPGLLWCHRAGAPFGFCDDPASRSSCGRCDLTCAPTRTCAAVAGVYACR